MTLRLAKLQNLLWRCSFAQTAQFAVSVYSRVIQRMQAWLGEHASMAWRTAYFNYGISGLCKDKELCKVLV